MTSSIDPTWVDKLKPLVEKDLQMRNVLLERGVLNDTYHKELEKIHLENAAKLSKLINQKGFPVLSNAGEEGVRLSWLIIHHAISLPDFMRECLIQMRLAGADRDYLIELVAYTEDRISYLEGRPQIYGTHLDWIDGDLKITPIEDGGQVNIRRRAVGLPPLDPNSAPVVQERPPKDPQKKAQEFTEWLKRVGWRS